MVSRRPVARKKNTGPIRFSLKTYAPEEIAKINARLGLDSERAFQPAEELLAEIAAVEEPTQEIPSAWFYHPDERAQLALLEREDLTPAWNPFENANRRILVLWATAFAHAQHESVAWTPVLDHIVGRRGYWPLQSHAESVLNSPTFRQWLPFWPRQKLKYWAIEEQAAPLRNWIRDAEPERIRTLVRLVARALDEAGDDIWTPLIERLFALHLWPTSAYDLDHAAPDPATRRRLVQQDEYLLKRVLPWVEAQTTPEVFIPIVRAFRANDLPRMIAHNASHVTTELADALVERTPLAVLWLSARTKGVSPVTRRHLIDRLVPLALDFGSSGFRGGINSTEIVQAYVLLQDASCLPTMAQVERLIRRLENDLKNGTRATREASDPNSQDDPVFGLLQYYIAATGDEKLAKRYIEVAEGLAEPKRVIHLLQPPLKDETAISYSIPTARAALKAFGDDARVCRVVAENRLFRANPEIRKVLLRSDSVDVAVQLAKDGRPEEFEPLFRFFVTRDPSYAALLIKRQPDVARAVLQPSDLAPLLTCSDRKARMVAITFLGELTADGPPVRQANPRV